MLAQVEASGNNYRSALGHGLFTPQLRRAASQRLCARIYGSNTSMPRRAEDVVGTPIETSQVDLTSGYHFPKRSLIWYSIFVLPPHSRRVTPTCLAELSEYRGVFSSYLITQIRGYMRCRRGVATDRPHKRSADDKYFGASPVFPSAWVRDC
ncbi:MAG: hypothetical protein CM1200mP18_17260 [Gammaproteobacteria bacterium]|nr:MAG: hypothetical protein CM1200mP18_17260 [Gammaproteobacteria bacterium]